MKSTGKPEPKAAEAATGALSTAENQDSEETTRVQTGHDDSERATEQVAVGSSILVTDVDPGPATNVDPGPTDSPETESLETDGELDTEPAAPAAKKSKRKSRARTRSGIEPNNVRKLRQEAMMSKAELARRAGVSPLTIDRVEAGCPCRMDTKRKILEALGLKPSARTEVWPDIDAQS